MAEQTVTVGVGALSIEDVIAVARGGAKVAISDESKHEMALSRAVIDHLADDTVPHYGISTGFGALASTSIPKEQRAQLQKSLKMCIRDRYMDEETGAEIHKYGAHLFHTSNKRVWDYVNRFTSFTNYVHRVYATHDGEVYPLPINLGTINQFFHAHYTPAEAKALIEQQAGELAGTDPANLNLSLIHI